MPATIFLLAFHRLFFEVFNAWAGRIRQLKIFESQGLKPYFCGPLSGRRGVRVVEGARLESVYSGNAIAGSNPALSAEKQMSCVSRHFNFESLSCSHQQAFYFRKRTGFQMRWKQIVTAPFFRRAPLSSSACLKILFRTQFRMVYHQF